MRTISAGQLGTMMQSVLPRRFRAPKRTVIQVPANPQPAGGLWSQTC